MILFKKILRLFLPVFLFALTTTAWAQNVDTTSEDGLFQAAKKVTFDKTDYPRAKAYLAKALRINPDNTAIKILLGKIYTWTKNYDSGRIAFREVLAKLPDYEEAVIPFIDLEYSSGNYEKALALCKAGLRNNPGSEELMLREAKILNALNRFSEADRAINKLLLLSSNNAEAIALAKSFREVKGTIADSPMPTQPNAVNKPKADTLSSDGLFLAARRAAFDSSDYPRAKSYLFKALQLSPNYADLRVFLGRIYTWTKKYDSARINFKQVLAKRPDYEDAIVAYTDLEYFSENYAAALELSRSGLRNNPTSEPLMLREARILNALKRFEEADRAITKLLLFNPDNIDAMAMVISFKAGRIKTGGVPNPVSPAYRPDNDTTSADGLFLAARKAAFDNNDYPRAKAYLFKALRQSPDYADVRIFLGRIYTWTKNYDSARIHFKQVLAKKPDYEDALVAFTDLEFFSDNYEAALIVCRGGLKNNPKSEGLLLREARILNALKRFDEAELVLDRLLLLNPNNTDARAMANRLHNAKSKPIAPVIQNMPDIQKAPISKQKTDTSSSDGLLIAARKAAFDKKDYDLAKTLLYHALSISPGYADIKVFLGRIHTWSDNLDSARFYFNEVLKVNPGHEDAAVAFSDMEYWNDNNEKSLNIVTEALVYHPASADLLFRKARALNSLRRYNEAEIAIHQVLTINRNNSDARSLANRIKELATKNKIGFSYDYVYFDKQFKDPWHLASFDYTRRTGIGSITGRINYANRFTQNGVQYELESYPRISKTFYSYISAGYSDNVGVFPQWRGGFSLYINLPKSYEADLGVRYLKFSGDPTWIYTVYLGKYYKSWLFGARAYVTPGTFTNTVSSSYTASARYYYGGADDLFGINIGYGISPDDRFNSIQIDNKIKLVSYKAGLSFKKKVSKFTVLSIDGSWFNQEYLPQTKGNQYQFSLGWLYRF